jgi:hypothetical protein
MTRSLADEVRNIGAGRDSLENRSLRALLSPAVFLIGACAVLVAHCTMNVEEWDLPNRLCASTLGILALGCMYFEIARKGVTTIPVLSFTAVQAYLFYGASTLWSGSSLETPSGFVEFKSDEILYAQLLVLLFFVVFIVATLLWGRLMARMGLVVTRLLPKRIDFNLDIAIAACVPIFITVSYIVTRRGGQTGPFASLAHLALSPTVLIALAWTQYLRLPPSRFRLVLTIVYTMAASIEGLLSGFLEHGALPVLVGLAVVVLLTGRIPKLPIVGLALLIVLVNPAKYIYREMVWRGGQEAVHSVAEKATIWYDALVVAWSSNSSEAQQYHENTVNRFSSIPIEVYVTKLVPEIIPHNGAELWSATAIGLVPRFLWKDKPSYTSMTNDYFNITFGLQSEESARQGTTLGLTAVSEGFWSSGILGVIIEAIVLGLFPGGVIRAMSLDHWGAPAVAMATLAIFRPIDGALVMVMSFLPLVVGTVICIWLIYFMAAAFSVTSRAE